MDETLEPVRSLCSHLLQPWLHPWGSLRPDCPRRRSCINPASCKCHLLHSGDFPHHQPCHQHSVQISPVILHYSYNLCKPKFLRRFGKICFFSVANYVITTALTSLVLRWILFSCQRVGNILRKHFHMLCTIIATAIT